MKPMHFALRLKSMIDQKEIGSYIDHTLLKPDATAGDIEKLCIEACEHSLWGVCVNGAWVRHARQLVRNSDVKVVSVAGFPLGAMTSEAKCIETEYAIRDGAQEIDVVLNVGRLKQGDAQYVRNEIADVVKAAAGRPVKVILETCLLDDAQKILACRLAVDAGAQFVKTSTGFQSGGATMADVRLMRNEVGPDFGVKASGGIRSFKTAIDMIEAGANRIGASASVAIVGGDRQ
jgi:deoxyribose-phosphate aldolase